MAKYIFKKSKFDPNKKRIIFVESQMFMWITFYYKHLFQGEHTYSKESFSWSDLSWIFGGIVWKCFILIFKEKGVE